MTEATAPATAPRGLPRAPGPSLRRSARGGAQGLGFATPINTAKRLLHALSLAWLVASSGALDEDLLFYLRARGIPEKEAQRLIVEGFFDPIMQRIPFEGVRGRFQQAIQDKMVAFSEEA